MSECQICKEACIKVLLDCGLQPLCNRFVVDPNADEYQHPLILGQCEACGLIQITQPVPAEEVAPHFEWLTYKEAEEHLDHLASIICDLPGITDNAVACGVSFKDDTILNRLKKKKFSRTWRIDMKKDFGITIPGAGVETLQVYLTTEAAIKLAKKYGRADVVIARHIYEHASNTHMFLEALRNLVAPQGYVIFEVPDCTLSLESMDYSMPWEEHILYFTSATFRSSFEFVNFSLVHYECYPYPIENALVAITQPVSNKKQIPLLSEVLKRELDRGSLYGEGLGKYREKLQRYLKTYKETRGKISIFGAGHLACMYINLMEIKDYIEFVVDDNPNKQGLYMPGSHLPIRSSHSLIDERITLCLLSLTPESEEKIIRKNQTYVEQGGTFASIFPTSKNRLNL
jgi:hypothetical protein